MEKKIIEFKSIISAPLSEVLKLKFSKKFYRRLKFLNALIFVNGDALARYQKVNKGDTIKIEYIENANSNWEPIKSDLDIYYEDSHYLICYKEANLLTIPTKACPISLYQQLLYYLKDESHISFINRLDRETQGLVLVAKDTYSANLLVPIKDNVKRKYLALVCGNLTGEGIINKKIKRSLDSNKRIIAEDGKEAITYFKVLKNIGDKSLVELELATGRTHQIRVHLASIGHPIYGDLLYSNTINDIMCLESYYLEFKNPYNNQIIKREVSKARWKNEN